MKTGGGWDPPCPQALDGGCVMLTAPLPLGRTFPSGQLCLRLNEVLAKSPVLTGEEEKPGQAARQRACVPVCYRGSWGGPRSSRVWEPLA